MLWLNNWYGATIACNGGQGDLKHCTWFNTGIDGKKKNIKIKINVTIPLCHVGLNDLNE